jgi:trk system potassium uptake protein TrkA
MYIVICGGGKVGAYLARDLSRRGHTVTVIEKREDRCQKIAAENPDVLVIQGDACDIYYLEEAEVERADVVAAVTGDDDDNLVISQLAREKFGVKKIIARVNNPKNEPIFHALGIKNAISSTTIIAHLIEEEASLGDIITLYALKQGNVALVETEVPAGSQAVGKKVAELGLPKDCVLVAILRGDDVIIPRGNTELKSGDVIMAVSLMGKERALEEVLKGGKTEACEL